MGEGTLEQMMPRDGWTQECILGPSNCVACKASKSGKGNALYSHTLSLELRNGSNEMINDNCNIDRR